MNLQEDIRQTLNQGILKIAEEESVKAQERVRARVMELAREFKYKFEVSYDPAHAETSILIRVNDIDINLRGRL